ncbi:response regulator [Sinirhodobacter populi]|nr:response regulator [Sinirhodobacter populi]
MRPPGASRKERPGIFARWRCGPFPFPMISFLMFHMLGQGRHTMRISVPERFRRLSLRTTLMAIILLAILPTLGVAAVTLINAAQSLRNMSTQKLMESAHAVAHATSSELGATRRLLASLARFPTDTDPDRDGPPLFAEAVDGGHDTYIVQGGQRILGEQPGPELSQLILSAATIGKVQTSNILPQTDGAAAPRIALAVPTPLSAAEAAAAGEPDLQEVVVVTTAPDQLVRSLARATTQDSPTILAITDGNGRIIGRSVDSDKFIGRQVPDWQTLKDLGTRMGTFEAQTLEGAQIIFAFREIEGTPGWVAVSGEAVRTFDWRWQGPVLAMIGGSLLTVSVAVAVALLIAHLALRPIHSLVRRAQIIGTGMQDRSVPPSPVPPSFIREFETLRRSLEAADEAQRNFLNELCAQGRALRSSYAAQQEAERIARIGSWSLDPVSGVFTCSDLYYEMLRLDRNGPPITMNTLRLLTDEESYRRLCNAVELCREKGTPYEFEMTHRRTNGSTFAAWAQGRAEVDAQGRVIRLAGTIQDISERKEQNERLAVLADNIPGGLIFRATHYPHQGLRFAYISAGTERLIDVSPSEITQSPERLFALILPADRMKLARDFIASRRSGQPMDNKFRIRTQTGALLWLRLRAARRIQRTDHDIWDGVAVDITASQTAEAVLERAKETAEKAERAKSDFLATMSHELRTPMNTLIGMSRLALQTELDPKQRNYLEKINASANVLLGLINDILDLSRIEAGGIELENTVFRLDTVLETVASVTSLRAEEKGLELTFSVAPDMPEFLRGDPLRLGQVLTNLVGNAVKFTERGDIVVSVSPVRDAAGRIVKTRFTVRDTGIGMTREQIEGLFQPFYQATPDISRRYGGTGLGLAISRRLVGMMKGKIQVQSTPGEGSTFSFTAALEPVKNAAEAEQACARRIETLRDRRVLIVDDNESARIALCDMVAGFGMHPEAAENGAEALRILRENAATGRRFDLVLADWQMPVMNGIDLARHIRQDAGLLGPPAVLMVTAYRQLEVLPQVQDLGLPPVLLKPVTQSMMFDTLLDILSGTGAAPATTREDTLAPFAALAGRRVLVVDDNALNQEVARDFLQLVHVEVETATNGREALEKLRESRFDAVLMDLHMPVMGGLDAVREIRRNPDWADLPVIALTAQAGTEAELSGLGAGMTGHLTKPIEDIALYRILLEQLGREVTHAPRSTQYVLDLPGLQRRLGGDANRLRHLAGSFLMDLEPVPADFRAHLEAGDTDAIAGLAHQVKGTVGYFGADALERQAEIIEAAARNHDLAALRQEADAFLAMTESCISVIREWLNSDAA